MEVRGNFLSTIIASCVSVSLLQAGLVENILSVIKEYKETRGLLPVRACILGPPTSGKTLHIGQLCQHYKLHHIKIETVIKEAIQEQVRPSPLPLVTYWSPLPCPPPL